jgi:2-keto-4-pentenoate hydratase/2-oxohepta-3-ene-1,7-dioic acid hydratase in catechol pathway
VKIGRTERPSPAGPVPRVMVVDAGRGVAIDAQRAEQERRLGAGDSPEAAARIAAATIPTSLAAGLGSVSFRADLERALADEPPADAIVPLAEVRWLPPVDPPRYRDFMTFEQHHHAARAVRGKAVPEVIYRLPTYYKGGHHTLIGDGEVVHWPGYSTWMDYELELGWVLAGEGVDLTPAQAEERIFGVTLLNDFSARDRQFDETVGNLGPAKGKDFATALGPWIVTADEIDLGAIAVEARVNGETWARGSSGDAMWTAAEVVAYLSIAEPLVPGELIGSGTFGGACGLEVGRQLVPGDRVELEADGIGTLTTELGEPHELGWEPPMREPGRTISGGRARDHTELLPPRADAPAPPYPRRAG